MRRRRSDWPAPGHVIRLSFLSLSLHAVASWHAFLGQEAVPTISGTSLQSSLQLPAPSTTADDCQVALTSLTKITGGRLCLQQQERCSLQCAVVWGSLLRDVGQVVGSQCTKLKEEMAAWRPDLQLVDTGFLGGVTSPVSMDELERLSAACSTAYKCPDHHCKPSLAVLGEDGTSSAPEFASLTPPALTTSCDFEVKQGEHTMRFLTWKALHESYLAKATGCVGGLSNSSGDAEHTTWACIHQPKCPTYHLPKGDLACFKYSHIRGEHKLSRALTLEAYRLLPVTAITKANQPETPCAQVSFTFGTGTVILHSCRRCFKFPSLSATWFRDRSVSVSRKGVSYVMT